MKDIKEIKTILETYKLIIKERFKIKEIGIFGSFVRGEETVKSDIDILVDFEKEGKTFDNYMGLKYFLQELFGLEVDLIMKGALKEELKDMILREVLYV
jgi:predicted nucleotidyltransferase